MGQYVWGGDDSPTDFKYEIDLLRESKKPGIIYLVLYFVLAVTTSFIFVLNVFYYPEEVWLFRNIVFYITYICIAFYYLMKYIKIYSSKKLINLINEIVTDRILLKLGIKVQNKRRK